MLIWVLFDNKVGSNKQTLAIAKCFSNEYIIKNIEYNTFIKLPNFIRGDSLFGISQKNSANIYKDFPDIVIATGRRLSSILLYIKKKNPSTKIIAILNPNYNFNRFDFVLLPEHDHKTAPNVLTFMGSFVDLEKVNSSIFQNYKSPLVSILIGGDTKYGKFAPMELKKILTIQTEEGKQTLLITTSRRTSDECISVLNENLPKNSYFYDWKKNEGKNNPYNTMLWSANYIVLTGDSINMICEACSTGKPVYIYMPQESISKKHYNFCKSMIDKGYAREFIGGMVLEKYKYKVFNEAKKVTDKLKEILSI